MSAPKPWSKQRMVGLTVESNLTAVVQNACLEYAAPLVEALKALRSDEWRVTVDWGSREPREVINESADALLASYEADAQERP